MIVRRKALWLRARARITLKILALQCPRNKMIVFTGPSGSENHLLLSITIFAEGQRRYVESLSAYARQFLNTMQKAGRWRNNRPLSSNFNLIKSHAQIILVQQWRRLLKIMITCVYVRARCRPHCPICIEKLNVFRMKKLSTPFFPQLITRNKAIMGVDTIIQKLKYFHHLLLGRKGEYYQLLLWSSG